MREYGIPAVAEVAPSATLADVVFERADREPQAVMMRRQADGGGPPWRDVTTAQFRAEVTALAKGLIAAGIGTGDRVALLSAELRSARLLRTPWARYGPVTRSELDVLEEWDDAGPG